MHMKSASVDIKRNYGIDELTSAGWKTNDENTVIIESKAQAKKFDEYFASIWNSIDNKWLVYNPHQNLSTLAVLVLMVWITISMT